MEFASTARKKSVKNKKRASSPTCAPARKKKRVAKKATPDARVTAVKRKQAAKKRSSKKPVCKPRKVVKPRPTKPPVVVAPSQPPSGVTAPLPVPPAPPAPPPGTPAEAPIGRYSGTFGRAEAERLLFRAGFGPRPGEADEVAALGLDKAVLALTRPAGTAVLTGPEPTSSRGLPLAPYDAAGHDHSAWLDRMVRSNQQLVERMALIFHDWFATSFDGVNNQRFMVEQTDLFRKYSLGSFKDLVHDITYDNAMLIWLSGCLNHKGRVNENYAREVMELFTLGVGRGAYTEQDVREVARSLTGWTGVWDDRYGWVSFSYSPAKHDTGIKTVFGKSGNFDWTDVARMVIEHPLHPSFFVTKLWGYFIPEPPPAEVVSKLERLYIDSGYSVRPVLEAILLSPWFYEGGPMVKPPVVYHAGMLRALGRFVTRDDWVPYLAYAGQRLYWPPDVSGWDDKRWLNANTMRARWGIASQTFLGMTIPGTSFYTYDASETPQKALERALEIWGWPTLSDGTKEALLGFAEKFNASSLQKAQRQNALRQLIVCVPDYVTC